MRGVTAIFLAAITGLSCFVGILSIFVFPVFIVTRTSTTPIKEFGGKPLHFVAINPILETYCIPITVIVAAFFLGFAWLCWWLANTVWPNRWFSG